MAKKKEKILTIGQLRYRKNQKDWLMNELLKCAEDEGIHLSKAQLLKVQKYLLKRMSKAHGQRVKKKKNHAKLRRDDY